MSRPRRNQPRSKYDEMMEEARAAEAYYNSRGLSAPDTQMYRNLARKNGDKFP